MTQMKLLNRLKKGFSSEAKYILLFFIFTRLVLTLVGVSSRTLLYPIYGWWRDQWNYNEDPMLNLWGIWDSGWYLDIARNGFSQTLESDLPKRTCCGQSNLGFFPLYPLLMKWVGVLIGSNYVAGVLISNLSLIGSAFILYKLVEKESGVDAGKRAVKYLFLFPTGFILSGVFSESLFLFFLLLTFYFAHKKNWFLSGVAGYFLALTKLAGALAFIPLIFEYLRQKKFDFKKIKPNILYLSLIPLGTLSFFTYTFLAFGNFFAYLEANSHWGETLANPLSVLVTFLISGNSSLIIIALFIIVEFVVLLYFRKKISSAFFLLAILLLLFSSMAGVQRIVSLPRHSTFLFPLFIILAKLSQEKKIDVSVTYFLIFIQFLFMIYWSNGVLII